jgi:hypothetical protein
MMAMESLDELAELKIATGQVCRNRQLIEVARAQGAFPIGGRQRLVGIAPSVLLIAFVAVA